MPEAPAGAVGKLVEVTGSTLIAALYNDVGRGGAPEPQVGSYVVVTTPTTDLLGQVVRVWEDSGVTPEIRRIRLIPLGEISENGEFSRGVTNFPNLGATVTGVNDSQLEHMFSALRETGLNPGTLSLRENLEVYMDPTILFGRHLAILGQSGSGKSWTVASLLQRTVAMMPKAHIVLLDLHGEYGWRELDGTYHSAFAPDIVRHVDARQLEIPYWLLNYAELVDLLIDRTDANASIQMAFMREVVYNLRKKANTDLKISSLSVDSPVYFSIKEMYLQFKKANEQQVDFGKTNGPLFGMFDEFLVRFQSMYNDARYHFLFRPQHRNQSRDLESLLRDFIGLGSPKRNITVIDLSPIPNDVRPTISTQIGRLAFEFNYWNPLRREFPILLVCEEAHQYIPRSTDRRHAATRKEMERIAKEGRKYGVGLCVVSQRPLELSETVLAQCANYICMRITNPDDQAYVRELMPEGEQGLAEMLTALRRGEALAVGEAIPLPTRFRVYRPDPPPMSSDAPIAESWRDGPDDIDVAAIVNNWWRQHR